MVLVAYKPINTIVLAGLLVMGMHFLHAGCKRATRRGTEEPLRHEATQEMRDGPSQSACRRRLQTTSSGCARTSLVVSVEEKASMRCQVWITKVSDERTNGRVETVLLMVSKWESGFCSQISRGGTCLRPRWHPASSWHERGLGFCGERGNAPWDGKRKP